MNELRDYFEQNDGNLIDKWDHYFEIYYDIFKNYADKPVVLLEIGVNHGGSLQMWKKFFHPESQIFGVDINPECKKYEDDNVEIFIGSQSDPEFLNYLKRAIPKVDILIDDGGHTMKQQITAFTFLFDHVKNGGVYLCEDINTSYWPKWGGGVEISSTFIEFSKRKIDSLNAWYSKEPNFKIDEFSRSVKLISFYTGIVCFFKDDIKPPFSRKTGVPNLKLEVNSSELETLTIRMRIKRFLHRLIDSFI